MSYYDKGEWKYPSVTTVISDCTDKSQALISWGVNCACDYILKELSLLDIRTPTDDVLLGIIKSARRKYREISQEALDVGSEVHTAIEVFLKREIARKGDGDLHWDITDPVYAKLSGQAMKAFNAFNAWHKEHELKPIAIEQTVYGDCWGGTLDFIGYYDGKLYVIDWKSSAGFYPEMRYQVAAYRWALGFVPVEDCEVPHMALIEGCGILRLDKKTGIPKFHDTSKSYERDIAVFKAMVKLYFSRHPVVARRAGWKTPF